MEDGWGADSFLQIYSDFVQVQVKDRIVYVSDEIRYSKLSLSLQQFIECCQKYCSFMHTHCLSCQKLVKAAQHICEEGISSLSSLYKEIFPDATYSPKGAQNHFSLMPVAFIRLGEPKSGCSRWKVMESVPGVDYRIILKIFQVSTNQLPSSVTPTMTKETFQNLLCFAQSRRERETLSYAAFKSSGLSATAARKHFGVDNLLERCKDVEEAIEESQAIHACIESLASMSIKASVLTSQDFGFDSSSESDVSEDSSSDPEFDIPSQQEIMKILRDSDFNWFNFVSAMSKGEAFDDRTEDWFERIYNSISVNSLLPNSQQLLLQSHEAYAYNREVDLAEHLRTLDATNGMVVEDRNECLSSKGLEGVNQKLKSIRRHHKYIKAKAIADRNFLKRKVSKRSDTIIKTFPDIGEVIEKFVSSCNVGADSWRRTGILTFDGNVHVGKKVTFARIKAHLEEHYHRKFSHGTVVELCVARNNRRRAASRYHGVAQVTCRRARKGFMLKYNPDVHWSSAFYRNLNKLQYSDGTHIVNLNRDDAAGFRLDTMTTHRLQKTPSVQDVLTTHTDYVNKYPSTLQTTSYNFSKTETTAELCAGVVKASGVFPKNPAQHSADIEALEAVSELKPAFFNPLTGERKLIECVRVDGACDEGPSHTEVQFFWTLRHCQKPYFATLVTSRSSGCSYLNRVELQNGCLALGHANIFIPSTLCGSNIDAETGKVHRQRFIENMEKATEVYLNRVNGSPCGETKIHLIKGADSTTNQDLRVHLLKYLKGSKAQKRELQSKHPKVFEFIDRIWKVRNSHIVKGLPQQYVFYLICCFQPGCSHPLCEQYSPDDLPHWYSGGPTVSAESVLLPIPDPDLPWGGKNCTSCQEFCHGHFLKPEQTVTSSLEPMKLPPSALIKEFHQGLKGRPTSDEVTQLSKTCLLPTIETEMWLEHLSNVAASRKRGAKKAAESRKKKRTVTKDHRQVDSKDSTGDSEQRETTYCSVCHIPYIEFTSDVETWIQCDECESWLHFSCSGLADGENPDHFYCKDC